METSDTKQCSECRKTKTLDEFSVDRRNRDGRTANCLACRRLAHQRWREGNREKYNAQVNRWRKANPEGSKNPDRRWLRALEFLGGECECGATEDLEFVHVRGDQSYAIEVGLILPWEMLKDELVKCDLVCPKCRFRY